MFNLHRVNDLLKFQVFSILTANIENGYLQEYGKHQILF